MDAYIYQAALYCKGCATEIRSQRAKEIPNFAAENYAEALHWDSNTYPAGPYADGGGESDTLACCEGCKVFLENPLTQAGYDYLRGMLIDAFSVPHTEQTEIISEWANYYEATLSVSPLRIDLDGGN